LFACTGQFSVSYKGILRDPSKAFFDEIDSNYKNKNYSFGSPELIKHKFIKIPDIYHIQMIFGSCIP
jgi:hypothetical protein